MRKIGLGVFLCLVFAPVSNGATISLWNFNEATTDTSGEALQLPADYGNGIMTSSFIPSNISYYSGTDLNSQMGDAAGQALNLRGYANNGENLTWMVDTTGFSLIDVSFATRGTSTGFNSNQFMYSVDSGISWANFGSPYSPGSSFALQNFDLSGIFDLDHNPGVGFRVVFSGATSSTGNNRIDNLVVTGIPSMPPDTTPVPEPSTMTLIALGLAGVFYARGKAGS
jgi:hypothetical protein